LPRPQVAHNGRTYKTNTIFQRLLKAVPGHLEAYQKQVPSAAKIDKLIDAVRNGKVEAANSPN
jgi:hypothetical protein